MTDPQADRPPTWSWLVLIAVLAFDLWLRAHTFGPILQARWGVSLWPTTGAEGEPLDCDEAAYAYIGRRIVAGDAMYRDLTENKPPLGYWLYALTVAIGGAGELSIRLMPIPMVLATIALVWWIGLRLAGPVAACLAAGIYAVLSTDPYLFGNGSNLEHAINLASVASLALMVYALPRDSRWAILAAGVCLGMASLIKQVAILHLPVEALVLLLRRSPGDRLRPRTGKLLDLTALVGGVVLPGAIALAVILLQGAGPAAYDAIIRQGGALVTDTPPPPHAPPFFIRWIAGNADPRNGALPWPFGRTDYLVWWGTGSWPVWLAALPALAWLLIGVAGAPGRLLAGWTFSAWVQVAVPRQFWQHYYLLPTPGLALAVASVTVLALARSRSAWVRRAPARGLAWALASLLLAASIGWTAAIQWRDYLRVPPEDLTVRYKGGRQWVALRAMGRELAHRTNHWPNPHLYVWGWQSPLFIYAEMDSVTPHFFANELMKAYADRDHPVIGPQITRILRDLEARPPELIFAGDPPFPALRAFLLAHYRPSSLGVAPDGRGLWVDRQHYDQFEGRAISPQRSQGTQRREGEKNSK